MLLNPNILECREKKAFKDVLTFQTIAYSWRGEGYSRNTRDIFH